jgi:hypothetical protein
MTLDARGICPACDAPDGMFGDCIHNGEPCGRNSMSQQDRDEAAFIAQVRADAAYGRPKPQPFVTDTRTLDPEWAAPGPTVYKTLLDEMHRDALTELTPLLNDLLGERVRGEALSRLQASLGRAYCRGIVEGYSQAARAFDSRPDDKSGNTPRRDDE